MSFMGLGQGDYARDRVAPSPAAMAGVVSVGCSSMQGYIIFPADDKVVLGWSSTWSGRDSLDGGGSEGTMYCCVLGIDIHNTTVYQR